MCWDNTPPRQSLTKTTPFRKKKAEGGTQGQQRSAGQSLPAPARAASLPQTCSPSKLNDNPSFLAVNVQKVFSGERGFLFPPALPKCPLRLAARSHRA